MDIRIRRASDLAEEAFKYLNKMQSGETPIIKTGQNFIDDHLSGVLPSDCIIYSANSGVGKTKLLYDTLDSILKEDVNKNAKDITTLEFQMEMKFLNRILRDTHTLTAKKKSEILTKAFTEEEKAVVKQYYESLKDDRRYICEESVTVGDFYTMTEEFCNENKHKAAIWIALDHVLLLKKSFPSEDTAETLTARINDLRKKFNNVYFILLTQMNRLMYSNVSERNNAMMPTTGMIYGSSHFEFLSSYIIAIIDPFKLGVNEFLKVNRDRYDWLEDFMTDEDKNGKVSFNTLGNSFKFVLKTRESDMPYKNLYINKMNLSEDNIKKMEQSVDKKTNSSSVPIFSVPTFEQTTTAEITPTSYADLSKAFDAPVKKNEDDSEPF